MSTGGGQRGKEGGGIFPEAPKLDPPSPDSHPHTPAFWLFQGQGHCAHPSSVRNCVLPPGPSWAGIVLEINVAVPARPRRLEQPPGRGALGVIVPDVWLPHKREASGWDRAGRSWLPQPMCPAGQGVGSPRLWCPFGLPGPRPLNWPFGSCPWPSWAESRLRPLTSQFFLSTSVTQGLNCPILLGADRPGGGWGKLRPPELP